MHIRSLWGVFVCLAWSSVVFAADPRLTVTTSESAVVVQADNIEILKYVFRDPAVSRPYFAPVRTLSGIQVSRNHPPQSEIDKADHAGLHTGIWLSFGDLSGHDYWRLKAKTVHVCFLSPPIVEAETARWTVQNRYLSTDGEQSICEETAHYSVQLVPQGYLLDMASEFRPANQQIVFGDQEEMGLGVRLNTPLSVEAKLGGQILDSEGRRNGSEVWGKSSTWCDYAGPLGQRWVGMALFSDTQNVRPSWNHARDYGFLAVNPFGRAAFTEQEPSRIVVQPGESQRLRFGVYVHESSMESDLSIDEVYQAFSKEAPSPRR